MIDEEKVRLMTKTEMLKTQHDHEIFVVSKFVKKDYVFFETIKTLVLVTIVYGLLLAILMIGASETLFGNMTATVFILCIVGIILIYVLLFIMTIVISKKNNRKKYKKAQATFDRYDIMLRKLSKM